jgi:hypothetical protein
MNSDKTPTCTDYRAEMMLLGLKRRLAREDLPDTEKQAIEAEIKKIEREIHLD